MTDMLKRFYLQKMAANNQHNSKRIKRRTSSPLSSSSQKCKKYNSFIPLLQEKFSEDSKKEFENLILLNVDVDKSDPEEGNCSPLCFAVQHQLYDWTKLLLKYGADPALANIEYEDGSIETVSEIAWRQCDYGIVLELLLADGPFPKKFELEKFSLLQMLRFKTFNPRIDEFHGSIRQNSFEKVTAFVKANPKTKYAYDVNNKSALTTALEGKTFKIYSFLRSNGFSCGVDEKHDILLKRLKKNEKKSLDKEVEKYFLSADFHILNLISKSRLGMNNDRTHFEKLKTYFERLDVIEEMQPILKIIASEKNFSLIFDFERSDIENLDPARCPINSEYKVRGRTYKKEKKILIAAKQSEVKDLLGILAQELTHFALLKVYDNDFLPYRADEESRKLKFAQVVEASYFARDHDAIIASAFKYENSEVEAELIARVPQLIIQNEPGKLWKNRETFKQLFNFFNEEVKNDIELEASLIESKQNAQDLNKTLGLLHRLKTAKLRLSRRIINEILKESHKILVPSKLPELALSHILESFQLRDFENIFVELEQLTISSNINLINDIFEEGLKPTIFVLDNVSVELERAAEIFNKLSECKIVFTSNRVFSQELFKIHPEVVFTFSDLTSESKQELLKNKVDFQGCKVELKQIFDEDIEEIESWPLENLIDASKIKINYFERFFPAPARVSINRSFEMANKLLSVEEFVAELEKQRTLILADVAGMGKTMAAVSIAKTLQITNPQSWIVFIDLKQHAEVFKSQKSKSNFDLNLVLENMLSFGYEIEEKLFKFFFENSNIFFIFDGFDEVSPNYTDFDLTLLQYVRKSGNRLMVTTRTHLESDLASKLGSKLCPIPLIKLVPFSNCNQIEFLATFWKQESDDSKANLEIKAERLLKKFRASLAREQVFLEIPLQLFMLADLTSSDPGSLNIETIFALRTFR